MTSMTRVAVGVSDPGHLDHYLRLHWAGDGPMLITRYMPKRHEEIAGRGSLYWIVKHALVARSPILAFGEAHGRVAIHLGPELVRVVARPRRAHQGWRYLEAADVPVDLSDAAEGMEDMPSDLMGRLASLGLV